MNGRRSLGRQHRLLSAEVGHELADCQGLPRGRAVCYRFASGHSARIPSGRSRVAGQAAGIIGVCHSRGTETPCELPGQPRQHSVEPCCARHGPANFHSAPEGFRQTAGRKLPPAVPEMAGSHRSADAAAIRRSARGNGRCRQFPQRECFRRSWIPARDRWRYR